MPSTMISYVMPTKDRPECLARTLRAIGSLPGHGPRGERAEVLIVDNDSRVPPDVPERLPNGVRVRVIRRTTNDGAASRNAGVQAADPESDWIVMLDDDSNPVDTGFIHRLTLAPDDVAAVSADIFLPGLGERERGGLPSVWVGCGVAIRRDVYIALGGYDPGFDYYVEEYDLAARMIHAGYRVEFDRWFRVEHHKSAVNRDMDRICARLVRNNGWVAQRYAPEHLRREELREIRSRYRTIALKERAIAGYRRGLLELRSTIRAQPRFPMTAGEWDIFTGLSQAREALHAAMHQVPFESAAIVEPGKNAGVVRRVLAELGVHEAHPDHADALVIGTMSPGPMLDALERLRAGLPERRVIAPWLVLDRGVTSAPLVSTLPDLA